MTDQKTTYFKDLEIDGKFYLPAQSLFTEPLTKVVEDETPTGIPFNAEQGKILYHFAPYDEVVKA